jgi:hypothetical protein
MAQDSGIETDYTVVPDLNEFREKHVHIDLKPHRYILSDPDTHGAIEKILEAKRWRDTGKAHAEIIEGDLEWRYDIFPVPEGIV